MLAKKIDAATWMIRLMKGEELVAQIRQFCLDKGIQLGWFTGLGAVEEAELGVFLHDKKQYESTSFKGSLEIIALHGNITTMHGELYLHIHLGISTEDLKMFGGHLNRAVINPTCEIILHGFEGTVNRAKDPESGLNHLDL